MGIVLDEAKEVVNIRNVTVVNLWKDTGGEVEEVSTSIFYLASDYIHVKLQGCTDESTAPTAILLHPQQPSSRIT